ncbi:MAG TPA: hypothetical protein VGD64_07475 [Acidisarcina sp.]
MRPHLSIGVALVVSCVSVSSLAQSDATPPQVSLAIRPSSQMEQRDAEVVAAHQSAIARAAAFYDFTLDSSWSYEQAVCPLAPQDILLNYYSRQPHGISSFSAVVPRQGSVIRIVPLVHDGTAPSVAPWGEHSYHVFNSMTDAAGLRNVSSSQPDSVGAMSPGDRFVWGLCYVALVNERTVVPHPDRELHVFSATDPTFRLGTQGGSELSFTVRDDPHYYSVWRLEFSPKGSLLRADRDQHMLPTEDLETASSLVAQTSPDTSARSESPVSAATVPANPTYIAPVQREATVSTERAATSVTAPAEPMPAIKSAAPSVSTSESPALASLPPEPRPASRTKQAKSEWHVIPDTAPPPEHPVPDSGPLVTRPVPQS